MRNLEREELSYHEGHEAFSRRGAGLSAGARQTGHREQREDRDEGWVLDRRLWTQDSGPKPLD